MKRTLVMAGLLAAFTLQPVAQADTRLVVVPTTFADASEARSTWRPIGASPAPDVDADGALLLHVPFTNGADRVVWDADVALDLSDVTSFLLDVGCADPQALRGLGIYLQSGNGWYVWNRPLREAGWQRLQLGKAAFSTEGRPAGWHAISRIRISPWKGRPVATSIAVHRFVARKDHVFVVTATDSTASAAERALSAKVADRVSGWLDALGVLHAVVSEDDIEAGVARDARVVILPLNPKPTPGVESALVEMLDRGGKLVVCYGASETMAARMGLTLGEYLREEAPGQWASIRFHDPVAWSVPARASQASWNLRIALPASDTGRVLATWEGRDGTDTGHPAWIATSNGLWFTHILLDDDTFRKQEMLLGLLATLDPGIWSDAAKHARITGGKVDAFPSAAAAMDALSSAAADAREPGRLRDALDRAGRARAAMDQAFFARRYRQAVEQAAVFDRAMIEAFALAQEPATGEMRAVWDHDGVGWYPGDWDRTARELKESGINTLFLNLQWAGLAHYESDVLPMSATRRIHGDQMTQSLAAARSHGLSHHVWKICWNIEQAPREFQQRMKDEGRVLRDESGRQLNWLDPSNPLNIDLEVAALVEIARRFPTDGIHLDYIRFPQGAAFDGDKAAAINTFVRRARGALKEVRPDLLLSAAVWGAHPACVSSVGQDWALWLREGWVDFVCPMNYTDDLWQFSAWLAAQTALPGAEGKIIPGIGVTSGESRLRADHVIEQILVARRAGVRGFALYDLGPTLRDQTLPMLRLGITAP